MNVESDADCYKFQKMVSDMKVGYMMQEAARIHSAKSKFKPYFYM